MILENGREVAHLSTVVGVEDGAWAETVSHASNVEFKSRTEVEAVDGGTLLALTQSFLGNPLAPQRDLEIAREQLRSHADTYVAHVTALLQGPNLAGLLPPSS